MVYFEELDIKGAIPLIYYIHGTDTKSIEALSALDETITQSTPQLFLFKNDQVVVKFSPASDITNIQAVNRSVRDFFESVRKELI